MTIANSTKPVRVVDKNGHVTTRHKRVDGDTNLGAKELAARVPVPRAAHSGMVDYDPDWASANLNTDKFPEPQANSISKLTVVPEIVALGCTDNKSIGEALGVTEREGAYYANAAGYLGLLDRDGRSQYALSRAGEDYLEGTVNEREANILQRASHTPGVQAYLTHGDEGLGDYLNSKGLSDTTVARRASTIDTWTRDILEHNVDASAELSSLDPEKVAAGAAAAKERREAARGSKETQGEVDAPEEHVITTTSGEKVCPSCYTSLPLSGQCDYCAE